MKRQLISGGLTKALLQLNLTEKEITTYVVLLERGGSSIQEISRASGINRVTTYAAIEALKAKGLVAESRRGKRKLFIAENPGSLANLMADERDELEKKEKLFRNEILPALEAININQEKKPQIKFFEGSAGIATIFDEYILKASSVLDCGSYDTALKVSTKEKELRYIEEIRKKKIVFRALLEDTPLNHEFADAGKGALHVKFLPSELKISADTLIFGQSVALISYEKATGTIIEDDTIAKALKMYLEFMWERL